MSVEAIGKIRRGRGVRKAIRQTRDITMLPTLKRGIPLIDPLNAEQRLDLFDRNNQLGILPYMVHQNSAYKQQILISLLVYHLG